MNQQQKEYALKRIESVKSEKINLARIKYKIQSIELNDKQRYDLIKQGKVVLIAWEKISRYSNYIDNWFDFSEHVRKEGIDEKPFNKISQEITSISTKAKDQIMLGDCEEALRLIEELESIKI